jgi:hypothetical protein
VPVTAKLSLKFYEKLGEDVANELVEWFNSVDATYRSDLRGLNELNVARLDAKLEQRLAEMRAEMRQGFARVDQRFAEFETKLTNRLFAFWVTQAATTVGLILGIVKLVGR